VCTQLMRTLRACSPLGPRSNLNLDCLPFFESLEIKLVEPAAVEKDSVPVCPNEPKSSLTHQLLDRAFHVHLT
jgi:hypothetical protein